MIELKACPFCNTTPRYSYMTSGMGPTIACENKECAIYNQSVLMSRWNKRPQPPESKGVVWPERKDLSKYQNGFDELIYGEDCGWNACRDEFKRLNPWLKES